MTILFLSKYFVSGFGGFNNFDGSVGVQGTGALVAVGDGVSQFAGQVFMFSPVSVDYLTFREL